MKTCDVKDCVKKQKSRGLCAMHLQRLYRYGSVDGFSDFVPKYKQLENWLAENSVSNTDECIRGPFPEHRYPVGYVFGGAKNIHRVVCEMEHGEATEEKPLALHSCGNKWCLNRKHLRWGSHEENMKDSVRLLEHKRGVENPQHVLNEDSVRDIRRQVRTVGEYARMYGVSTTTIYVVQKRRGWRHVE